MSEDEETDLNSEEPVKEQKTDIALGPAEVVHQGMDTEADTHSMDESENASPAKLVETERSKVVENIYTHLNLKFLKQIR
ncbi:hypothetical protein R1flu_012227 [Riccia fluitans]|uniref:Uncharacterized protein n=1 Tax=Riccia fluitans TaxID=41844 RepID=A0ABD1Z9Z5_9MARC